MAVDPDGARHAPTPVDLDGGPRGGPPEPPWSSSLKDVAIATVRTFVAVLLPGELRGQLALEIDGLRRHAAGVAWTTEANLHVTLKFLGGVEEAHLGEIEAALRRAETVPAFDVEVRGLGAFPSAARARVLWAGVSESAEFVRLASDVDRALAAVGLPAETRGFTPHVTLGRVREPRRDPALASALAAGATRPFGSLRVDRVSLMRSDLSPRGARYTELAAVPLRPEQPQRTV